MAREPLKNVGASVRARLLQRSRDERTDFQILLTRYALERLLYRLSQSEHRCTQPVGDDGVVFDVDGLEAAPILDPIPVSLASTHTVGSRWSGIHVHFGQHKQSGLGN